MSVDQGWGVPPGRSRVRRRELDSDHEWFDGEAGPLVRAFALTRGRSQPDGKLFDLLSYVVATGRETNNGYLQPEHKRILDLAGDALSVAELASRMDLALGVVRVLLADL